jgi:AraC-like DNA-binding protein
LDNRDKLTISSNYLKLICYFLEHDGLDFYTHLKDAGIEINEIVDDDTPVSYAKFIHAIHSVRQEHPDYPFGLSVGSQMNINYHGIVTMAALSSETVTKGLEVFAKYIESREPFFAYRTSTADNYYHIDVLILDNDDELRASFTETAFLVLQNTIENLSGFKLHNSRVELNYPAPAYAAQYSDYFSTNQIVFNANRNRLSVPLSITNQPCITANTDVNLIAEIECRRQLSKLQHIPLTLENVMLKMRQPDTLIPSIDQIAESYSISSRTLIRFLRKHDTTYKALKEELKKQRALEYLSQQRLSINKTAMLLGYAETANFRRAFKRWYGCNPSQFQQQR